MSQLPEQMLTAGLLLLCFCLDPFRQLLGELRTDTFFEGQCTLKESVRDPR